MCVRVSVRKRVCMREGPAGRLQAVNEFWFVGQSQSGDHAASSGLSDSGWSASEDEAVSSPKAPTHRSVLTREARPGSARSSSLPWIKRVVSLSGPLAWTPAAMRRSLGPLGSEGGCSLAPNRAPNRATREQRSRKSRRTRSKSRPRCAQQQRPVACSAHGCATPHARHAQAGTHRREVCAALAAAQCGATLRAGRLLADGPIRAFGLIQVPVEVVTEEMLNQVVRLDLVETDTVSRTVPIVP